MLIMKYLLLSFFLLAFQSHGKWIIRLDLQSIHGGKEHIIYADYEDACTATILYTKTDSLPVPKGVEVDWHWDSVRFAGRSYAVIDYSIDKNK